VTLLALVVSDQLFAQRVVGIFEEWMLLRMDHTRQHQNNGKQTFFHGASPWVKVGQTV
jgi:hypothetical protein